MFLTLKCKAMCMNIHKTSTSPAFKNIQIGDVLKFSVEMNAAGVISGGGSKAKYIRCINTRTMETSYLSFNQIANILSNYDFTEII